MIEQDNLMRTNLLVTIREMPKRRGAVVIMASILIGLTLARFMTISPTAAIMALSSGIVLALAVLLRKIDYLIFGWIFLTSLIWFIVERLLPLGYYPFVGRGIFWGLLICIIAAWAIDNILSGRAFLPFNNLPLKATLFLFILWCALTMFTSLNVFVSLKKLVQLIIALATSYMFYDFFSRDENNIKKFFKFVSLTVIFLSFATLASAIQDLTYGLPIYKKVRLWFTSPNVLGSLLFVCTPLLISSGFDFRPVRRIRSFLVLIVFLALFFSFHRASWLALIISLSYLLWKSRMKIAVLTAIVATLFLFGSLVPVVGGPMYEYISGERYSGRKEIWQAAWDTALDYPLLGTGIGNSVGIIDKHIETPWHKRKETHNVYLQNAVEMGFMATLPLLAFYIIFLYSCSKIESSLRSPYLKSTVRATLATFIGLFVHGIFGNFGILTAFSAGEFYVILPYILLALPFAAERIDQRAGEVTDG